MQLELGDRVARDELDALWALHTRFHPIERAAEGLSPNVEPTTTGFNPRGNASSD